MRLAGSLALRALHFFIRLPKQRHRRVHFLEQFTPPSLVEIHHTLVGGHRKYFFPCFCYTALFLPSCAQDLLSLLTFLTACLDLALGFVSFDDFWIVSKSFQWVGIAFALPLPFGLPGCSFCFHT